MSVSKKISKKTSIPTSAASKIIAAGLIYLAFAIVVYHPHIKEFHKSDFLFIANAAIASLGCFVLSRRWISSFIASLFAGAVYGFCPFSLSFSAYHSFGTFPLAAIPWLFCIAAFVGQHTIHKKNLLEITGIVVLTLLPFAAIAFYFWMCAQPWWIRGPFFPIPKSARLSELHLLGFIAPLSTAHKFSFAFYHVPIALMTMGSCMYIAARRFSVLGLVVLGFALAFFDTWTHVSPVVWAIVPVLFCSILAGIGMQGLDWAGNPDQKWILLVTVIMLGFAGTTIIMPNNPQEKFSCMMYLMGAAVMGIIYFIARARQRLHLVRWILLSTAMALDITIGAIYIIDKIL